MLPAESDEFLVTVTRTIVDRFAPERIVLFGSRGRGDHHDGSDYDLIVVLDTSLGRGERDRPIREALNGCGRTVDVIVYTPAEFERRRFDVGALAYAGESEGQVLYDRTPSRWLRQVREDDNTVPASLADWLARAESDIASMADILAGSQSPDGICFHAHQSAEKFLKSVLIRSRQPPPRTHSLPELLGQSVVGLRDDQVVAHACALLHSLWPMMRSDHPMPTLEEAESAASAARDVRAAVLGWMKHRDGSAGNS